MRSLLAVIRSWSLVLAVLYSPLDICRSFARAATLLPIRLVIILVCTILLLLNGTIALLGAGKMRADKWVVRWAMPHSGVVSDGRPLPQWRKLLMQPMRFWARILLIGFGARFLSLSCLTEMRMTRVDCSKGYLWVNVRGRPVSGKRAPTIVSNHSSMIDGLYYALTFLPSPGTPAWFQ